MPQKKPASIGLDRLKADLRAKAPSTAYIICGTESYLKDYYISVLRKTLLDPATAEFNHRTLSGADFSMTEFSENVEAMPSFAERTLIEVADLDIFGLDEDDTAEFIEIISDLPEWCCVLFTYSAIEYKQDGRRRKLAAAVSKNIHKVEINEQEKSDLRRWIVSHFGAHKKKIAPDVCEYLTFMCGSMMSGLNSEIEKIATWSEGESITKEDIDAVVVPVLEAAVFDLTDAIGERKFDKAASELDKLLTLQHEPLQILGAVSTNFRRMLGVTVLKRCGGDSERMLQLIRSDSDFYMKKLLTAGKLFGEDRLADAIRRCADAELDIKSRNTDEVEVLTDLLIRLAANG